MKKKFIQPKVFVFFLSIWLTMFACNLPPISLSAVTLTVNTTEDIFDKQCTKSHCSLRDAVYEANHIGGIDRIILPAGEYRLNQQTFKSGEDEGEFGDLDIFSPITITGDGVDTTSIDGMGRDRIFHILN